jgi:hypothetical protein
VYIINCDQQSAQWLVSASQHSLTHSSTRKTTRLTIKRSTISIRLTVYTKDKAVGIAADDTTSVEEAIIAMATIAVATVAMATIAATTIREATVKKAEEDTKAFNRRNATSATNQDAGLTSIS